MVILTSETSILLSDGYRRIGQGHCLSTITPPAYGGYDIDDSSYGEDGSSDLISTEGCFSCKV